MKIREVKYGWAVQIEGRNGKTFLASGGGHGVLPAVWDKNSRRLAVEFKRDLLLNGFKCKVVRVGWVAPFEREEGE